VLVTVGGLQPDIAEFTGVLLCLDLEWMCASDRVTSGLAGTSRRNRPTSLASVLSRLSMVGVATCWGVGSPEHTLRGMVERALCVMWLQALPSTPQQEVHMVLLHCITTHCE
jgi:hypothetical protein